MSCRVEVSFTNMREDAPERHAIEIQARRLVDAQASGPYALTRCRIGIRALACGTGRGIIHRAHLEVEGADGRCAIAAGAHDNPTAAIAVAVADIHRQLARMQPEDDGGRRAGHVTGHLLRLPSDGATGILLTEEGARVPLQPADDAVALARLRIGDRVWCAPPEHGAAARIVHVARLPQGGHAGA